MTATPGSLGGLPHPRLRRLRHQGRAAARPAFDKAAFRGGKCYALPDLHAGKMHALLFRKWKHRVKGRDWFDFEWYVHNAVPLHLAHLEQRARQSGDWDGPTMAPVDFQRLLQQRIDTLDVEQARADVRPFLRDARGLEIWSGRYFRDLAEKVVCA